MNSYFCSQYAGPSTVWPKHCLPGNLFSGYTSQRFLQSQIAWNFYEEVEAADAATRVKYSNQGGWKPPATSVFSQNPSLWYPLNSQQKIALYRRGQLLHQQACPNRNWTSQRLLGIPTTPLLDVCPAPLA